MEIRKTNSINFGNAIKLKTNNQQVLNMLEYADWSWRANVNPKCRFQRLSGQQLESDGYVHGLILDGGEKEALHGLDRLERENSTRLVKYKGLSNLHLDLLSSIAKGAKDVIVSSVDELQKLPIFKGISLDFNP